jgi:hypothetical protein
MPPTPAPETRDLVRQIVTSWNDLVLDLGTPSDGALARAIWQSEHPPLPEPYCKYPLLVLLQQLITVDPHLQATCREPYRLARAFDVIALDQLASRPFGQYGDVTLDRIADFLVARLYEDDYARRVYFRFYNLVIEESPLHLPGADGQLDWLDDREIPSITGESTPTNTLHLPNTGNVFLSVSDSGPEGDASWWQSKWREADALLGVLKYVKYAVIEIDYSAIHFSPAWLNQVRRYGIPLWGRPRADVQTQPYVLARGEERTVARYLAALVKFKPLFENLQPTLRRAIYTAGEYYEGHHKRTKQEDQLIDLVIALEALFSPSEKVELGFRISHRAALLLGNDAEQRRELARFFRRVYNGRSVIVHEGKSPFVAKVKTRKHTQPLLSVGDLGRAGDLVRQAILRLSILYARGHHDRESALQHIEDSGYDPMTLAKLRQDTEADRFLTEQEL